MLKIICSRIDLTDNWVATVSLVKLLTENFVYKKIDTRVCSDGFSVNMNSVRTLKNEFEKSKFFIVCKLMTINLY